MIPAALLIAAATAGAPALPPRPPDATYTYTYTQAGATVGSSTFSVDGTATGTIVVKESASFTLAGFTARTTMRYDAATLEEAGYTADFTSPRLTQHMNATFNPGSVSIAVSPGVEQAVDIPALASAPIELVGDNLVASGMFIPALVHASGAKAFTLAVMSGGGKAIPATVADAPAATRPASVPEGDARMALDFAGFRAVYWYDPVTYVVHDLEIPAQRAEFRLTSTSVATAAVAPPAPLPTALPTPFPHFTSRDVQFTSADGTILSGTLTVPDHGRAPFAAVVLVHGSGAEDRDEAIGPNPVFLQLSNALSNAGYAVLRYDKRGVGKSGGRNTPGTRDELLADVKAAYHFARGQHEVDARHVYLLGHSEGGELVPSVAAAEPGVAGIILMAPPALPLWRVLLEQSLAGTLPDQRARIQTKALADFEHARHSDDFRLAWVRSSMDVDPIVDIKRVRAPILILQGEDDAQVLVTDLPRLAAAARSVNHDVIVRTFPHDNHLFEAVTPGIKQIPAVALQQYLTVPARIDARVLDALEGWLARRAEGKRG